MKLKKLNLALQELDALENVIWHSEKNKEHNLEVQFGCPDGGHYEDVILRIYIDGVSVAHLPNYLRGKFEVLVCESMTHKLYVPSSCYEEYEKCVRFRIDGKLSRFYFQCQSLSWEMTGNSGFLLNKYELKPTDFYKK